MVFFAVSVPGFYFFSSWFFLFFSFVFKYVFVCCDLIMSTLSEDFFGFLI